jgi:hypothetical protein
MSLKYYIDFKIIIAQLDFILHLQQFFFVMEGTSSLRMIEELQEASMDMAIAEAPMIGLQTTEENIESSICNAMEDEEAENEETICQTSSDTGVINMR